MKTCTKCGEEKNAAAFYIRRASRDGLSFVCKECTLAAHLAWAKKNPARHAAHCLAGNRRWRKANPAYAAAYVRGREAQKLRATPAWANSDEIRKLYDEAARLTRETGVKHHVDHIVPLKSPIVSGLHVHNNLQAIPASVNRTKGNRYWPDMP